MSCGHNCLARHKLPRLLLLLLLLLVLASIMTFFVIHAEARDNRPEIITYGQCHNSGQEFPYYVQIPLPKSPPQPKSLSQSPVERKSYSYSINSPTEEYNPSKVGFEFPVSIQEPLSPPNVETPVYYDPLRGKSYGFRVEFAPTTSQEPPTLQHYSFGIQQSIPPPKPPAPIKTPSSYKLQIQPCASPKPAARLWEPLPIGIQHPVKTLNDSCSAPGPAPRLTGLTSRIDRILIPAYCPSLKQVTRIWRPLPIGVQHPVKSLKNSCSAPGPPPRLTGLTSRIDRILVPAYCPSPKQAAPIWGP